MSQCFRYVLAGLPCALLLSACQAFANEVEVKDCRTAFVNRITFSSDRTGVVGSVPEEGAVIEPNEIVVRLRDEIPKAELKVAEAKAVSDVEIRVAEKTAQAARVEHDAAFEANQITRGTNPAYPNSHMLRMKLEAEAAALRIEQAQHEQHLNALMRDQAQAVLESYWIISDLGGTVTKVFKHAGEGVQQGEAIVQVVNTDRLRIDGYVKSEYAFLMKAGAPVRVVFTIPVSANETREVVRTGKLGFVDVSIQQLTQNVRVWAEIDNSDGQLREGMPAQMWILDEAATN